MSGPGLETAPIMEALLLNCTGLNLGLLLNNIWTWLAVMTAAVGLWRIRSLKPDLGLESDPVRPSTDLQQPNCQNNPVQDSSVRITGERTAAPEPDWAPSTSARAEELCSERVTKGNKYKEYYYTSGLHAELGEERGSEGGWEGGDWVVVKEWSSGSPTVEVTAGGMGWYSYQDTDVLDGSVVRLWDHARAVGCCRRRLPSPVGVTRCLRDCN